MNDETPIETETSTALALALPTGTTLKSLFDKPDEIAAIISNIESEVLAEVPDLESVKGRKRVKSLAYKVSQTKTTLDGAGITVKGE